MAIPTTRKECTTRRIASLIIGLWDKVKNAFQPKLPTTGTPSSTYSIGITGNSSTSDYPSGFNNRGTTTSWGTVKESNGYTTVTRWATQDGSEIAMGKKSGALSVQINGVFYQKEGMYRVLDESDIGNTNGKVATGDHTHGTLSDNFTVTLPNQDSDVGWQNNIGLSNNGFWLRSIRTQSKAPYWIVNNYASAIAFGGSDTKGVISLSWEDSRRVRFAGGSEDPIWWAGFRFGSDQEYRIGTGKYIPSCPDISKGSSSVPVYVDTNGIIQACSNIPVIEHVTTIPVNPTVGTIYAL